MSQTRNEELEGVLLKQWGDESPLLDRVRKSMC
jgi:hypothetical protein